MTTISKGRAALVLVALSTAGWSASKEPQTIFATPELAANALLDALTSQNYPRFLSVAGQQMAGFWGAGDSQTEFWDRDRFVESARKKGIQTNSAAENRRVLYAGSVEQAFPAPLVKADGGWRFDDEAGSRELSGRRIRRNEIAVAELCVRFRDAEYAYLATTPKEVRAFAGKIRSTPGRHDGLFWSDPGEEDESPMGPSFAAAAYAEREPAGGTQPLFGYYFKILLAQGPHAAGGELDYHTDGQLRKGFALIAWPAKYGTEGTHSFLINHFGEVYQKDLGADTARIAECMTVFDPDPGWEKFNGWD